MSDSKEGPWGSIADGQQGHGLGPVLAGLLVMLALCGCGGPGDPDASDARPDETASAGTRGPGVRVVVELPGASCEEIERTVTVNIEAVVTGLVGAEEVRSTSGRGTSTVDVKFKENVRAEDAMAAVRRVVATVVESLPADAGEPEITSRNGDRLVACVTVDGDVAFAALRSVGEELRDGLGEIAGVKRVEMVAEASEVRIEISPESLRRFGLSAVDLRMAIETGVREGADLRELVVRVASDGTPIRMADVAEVHVGTDGTTIVRVDGKGGVLLLVRAAGGEVPATVAEGARGVVAQRASRVPEGVRVRVHDCTPAGRAEAPVLRVAADCPGRTVEQVERSVAAAAGSSLGPVKGVTGVCTVSTSERVEALVAFERGTGLPDALARVRAGLADRQRPGTEWTVEPVEAVWVGRLEVRGGASAVDRSRAAEALKTELRSVTGVARVDAPALAPPRAELEMVLKEEAAATFNLTLKDVGEIVRSSSHGPGTVIDTASGPVRIVTVEGARASGELGRLPIPVGDGQYVPLAELVEMEMTRRRAAIHRVDGQPCITLEVFGDGTGETTRTVEHVHSLASAAIDQDPSGRGIVVRFVGR